MSSGGFSFSSCASRSWKCFRSTSTASPDATASNKAFVHRPSASQLLTLSQTVKKSHSNGPLEAKQFHVSSCNGMPAEIWQRHRLNPASLKKSRYHSRDSSSISRIVRCSINLSKHILRMRLNSSAKICMLRRRSFVFACISSMVASQCLDKDMLRMALPIIGNRHGGARGSGEPARRY